MSRHRWDRRTSGVPPLVRPVPVDPSGCQGPTRGQARGPGWRRTSPGHYVPAGTDSSVPEQRALEASMRLPAQGVVSGWAACRLHGANLHDGLATDGMTERPVLLVVGNRGGVRRAPGIAVSFEEVPVAARRRLHGIPVTDPERATWDEAVHREDLREAVVAIEAALAGEITSLTRLRALHADRVGALGRPLFGEALDLACEDSWSPPETRLRLVAILDAGLPRGLEANRTILGRDGRFLGIADLLDTEAGLVIEFDGAEHRGVVRHGHDVVKEDRLRQHCLEVVRVTGRQLPGRAAVVERLLAARARARFVPPDQRDWVLAPRGEDLEERILRREALAQMYAEAVAQELPDVRGW